MIDSSSRVSTRRASDDTSTRQFADDVRYYLSLDPRQLPSRYLYDALGSALFDAICQLPWYQITRAERRLLAEHGADVFAAVGEIGSVVELGGGNGEKLLTLIESGAHSGRLKPSPREDDLGRLKPSPTGGAAHADSGRLKPIGGGLAIHLIDVSAAALALSARVLSALDNVRIVTHQATYENGLIEVGSERVRRRGRVLTLFLGSNIGNFDPPAAEAFLRAVRASMYAGDTFLLGADLIKPEAALVEAYDDPLGVTAAFNRNLLVRINRELGGTFDLDGFSHRAIWNDEASRVEMHLVSRRPQRARIGELDLAFEEGETIWTESSYKYTSDGIVSLLERRGFRRLEQWTDADAAFSLTLAEAVE